MKGKRGAKAYDWCGESELTTTRIQQSCGNDSVRELKEERRGERMRKEREKEVTRREGRGERIYLQVISMKNMEMKEMEAQTSSIVTKWSHSS